MLTTCDKVYYEVNLESTKTYPYIVYEIQDLLHEDGKTLAELEVNVIDYGTSTQAKEEICDHLQALMHKAKLMTAYQHVSIYRGLRQPVEEDDRLVRRSRLTFELHLHERRGE